MVGRWKISSACLREVVAVAPGVVKTDRAGRDVVVPDALGRMQDVRLAMSQVRLHVLDQVLKVGEIRFVRADVLGCVYGIELDALQGVGS